MFLARYDRTMKGAVRTVPDIEICLRPKREAVAALPARVVAVVRPDPVQAKIVALDAALARAAANHPLTVTTRIDGYASASSIIGQVAFWHRVTSLDIISESRNRKAVAARFDAVAAVYLNCRLDGRRYLLSDLGRLFNRDHNTIIHALKMRGLRATREAA